MVVEGCRHDGLRTDESQEVMCCGYFYTYVAYLVLPQLLVHVSVSSTNWVLVEVISDVFNIEC
jgi:hypothetical protein